MRISNSEVRERGRELWLFLIFHISSDRIIWCAWNHLNACFSWSLSLMGWQWLHWCPLSFPSCLRPSSSSTHNLFLALCTSQIFSIASLAGGELESELCGCNWLVWDEMQTNTHTNTQLKSLSLFPLPPLFLFLSLPRVNFASSTAVRDLSPSPQQPLLHVEALFSWMDYCEQVIAQASEVCNH